MGLIDADFYAGADAFANYRREGFKLGGHLPLRLMLTGSDGVRLRRQDWDETSDFTRVLRYLDWAPNADFHLRLGEPTGVTLGHGAIVDHYYNATDLDHYKTALRVGWQNAQWGLEVFSNDLMLWEIFAARGHFRPLGDTKSWARDLQIGLTFSEDRQAPRGISAEIDATRQPVVPRAPLYLYGVDADIPLWRGSERQLLLYTDLVAMHHGAVFAETTTLTTGGWHNGIRLHIPKVAEETDLSLRAEAVWMGNGYLPGFFNSLYEVERFQVQAASNDGDRNKVAWAALHSGGSMGLRAIADVITTRSVRATAILALLGRDGMTTQLWAATPEFFGWTVRAHWGQQHILTADDMRDMSRTAVLAEVRYRLAPAMSFVLQAGTRWLAKDSGYAARRELLGAARFEWKL